MGRPGRWTFVAIILYLSFPDKALCQQQSSTARENRECSNLPVKSSATDMYNSILTSAACNGVLPDLISKFQGQPTVESLSKCPYPQEILTKPLSVVPITSGINTQEPFIFSSQSFRQPPSNQNVLLTTPLPSGSGCSSIPSIPQAISAPPLPSPSYMSQIAQALPAENYPACAPNGGVLQPKPIVLQPQSQCNAINSYFYNQIAEQILPEVSSNFCNLPTLPPLQTLSPIACSGLEITSNLGLPSLSSTVLTNECQQAPLQVNVPLTSLPIPKITVVSNPSNCPVPLAQPGSSDCLPNLPPYQFPPQPPIVVGSSKSSWKKWLPILLVALLNDRGYNDGGGCSRCCCSSNGGNNIPIPFPIPVPVNNPIINTGSCRRDRDDVDEEDDRKRK